MAVSTEPTVTLIVSQAEALASRRHEALSGTHLLAAVGSLDGRTRDLLDERGAGFRKVLDAWERLPDHGPAEDLSRFLSATSGLARRHGTRTATAPHVLLALLNTPTSSARRVLELLGADVTALRNAALQVAQGLPMRRSLAASDVPVRASLLDAAVVARPRGTAVPVMPSEPVVPLKRRSSGEAPLPIRSSPPPSPSPLPPGALGPVPRGRPAGEVVPLLDPARARVSSGAMVSPSMAPPSMSEVSASSVLGGAPAASLGRDDGAPPPPLPMGSSFELSNKRFPILTQIGRNLTRDAHLGRLEPVIGRDEEIEQALDVLAKRHGNNPCLIGPAGVGKTSIARGIAARIAEEHASGDERLVIEIPISELVSGTGTRGALAARLGALKKEVLATEGRVILFFDEIHQLFSGDAAEELASDLRLTLARGELPCIGATSVEEYRRVIEADPALSRRFSAVEIDEPTREEAFLVLSALAERLSLHHGVRYEEEALALAVSWSVRYLPGRALPDKAISLVDLAGARRRRRGGSVVGADAVAEVVAVEAAIPLDRLLESDSERMLVLHEFLSERVIGHEAQMEKIARILRRNAAGLGSRRPIGTFLLLGPTGVGKTETAKAIAEALFHSESAMTRIDMAEMSEAHAVAKLVGSPPGYVGHEAGGQLTEAVRRRPYQVLLLDEIEKAHPEVLTAFLAVFDEGRMTDSRGRLVDFTNTVIVLTSNLGAQAAAEARRRPVGFGGGGERSSNEHDVVIQAAKKALAPELYNRIDEVLAFSRLEQGDVLRIGRKMLKNLADQLELSRGVTLTVSDAALSMLLEEGGFDADLGARPLRRTIARRIEAPLAEALLGQELGQGGTFSVDVREGLLAFEAR